MALTDARDKGGPAKINMDEFEYCKWAQWVIDGEKYMKRAAGEVTPFLSLFSYDPMHIDDERERILRRRIERCGEGLLVKIIEYSPGWGYGGLVLTSTTWDPEGAWKKKVVDRLRPQHWHLQTRGTKAARPK